MTATLEKVINGFILEGGGIKRVGMTLNDILPTIYDLMKNEMINCIEEVGDMCWKLEIEINVTPTIKQDGDCDAKEVPCNESETCIEPAIGSIVEHKGKHFLCVEVEEETCYGCYFANKDCARMGLPPCNSEFRKDGKSVIFVRKKENTE